MAAPFYIPSNSDWRSPILHILTNTIIVCLSVKWYLFVVLTYISLITNYTEYLFICLLVIPMSS